MGELLKSVPLRLVALVVVLWAPTLLVLTKVDKLVVQYSRYEEACAVLKMEPPVPVTTPEATPTGKLKTTTGVTGVMQLGPTGPNNPAVGVK